MPWLTRESYSIQIFAAVQQACQALVV